MLSLTRFTIRLLLFSLLFMHLASASAQQVSGKVTNPYGLPLPYASVYLKGNTRGTVANAEGKYFLELPPGDYTIVCAYVGYQRIERKITLGKENVVLDFKLQFQQTELGNVEVKANAEDPAYAIIRQAIRKRPDYLNEVTEWQSMVYMKGLIRTLAVPERVMGVKVTPNRDVIDSSGKGIVYFSESLTRYFRKLPNEYKEEVVSAKVAGNSSGFGFNSPKDLEINLYENNISIAGLNSRGFVSPISDNALHYYKYKFEGTYFEEGREILRVRVMPRRKYEPLFAGGYIEIVEGSWRIHSVNLYLNKASQIELVDSLHLRQQMLPVDHQVWMPQKTEINATFGIFGFRAKADFIAVYSDYDIDSDLDQVLRSRVIRRVDTSANKKTVTYWDSIRPMPLTAEERLDYLKKDTLEQKMKSPGYLDSIDQITNKLGFGKLFLRGSEFINRRQKTVFSLPALVPGVQYNTVEGWAYEIAPSFRKWGDSGAFNLTARLRYGIGIQRFQASANFTKTVGKDYRKRWQLSVAGGRNMFQINPDQPIQALNNSIATLVYTVNHMKLYEKSYGRLSARRTLNNGLRLAFSMGYEDRTPLENSDTSYMWNQYKDRSFTSNYPPELPPGNFVKHQAFLTTASVTWQAGQKFLEYPNRRYVMESEKPVVNLTLVKAWRDLFGADADFGKWLISVDDQVNMKLGGTLNYRGEIGGFIRNDNVQLPDWRHFWGNQTVVASPYTRSFQLAPYYANSTRDQFFITGHVEWHLNGLLTNKIPVMRKWNWNLVTGSNAFFVDTDRNYVELFFGLENILKTIRVDWVAGYDGFNKKPTTGFVIGFGGLLTGQGVD